MNHDILAAMRREAANSYDGWLNRVEDARARITQSLVWPRRRAGGFAGIRPAQMYAAQILARAALALFCLLGPGLIFRGFFAGFRRPREDWAMLWLHRGIFIAVGLYWLMSAVYHWNILKAERGKDANLRRADRIAEALKQKKEALKLADASQYAAAAATRIQVSRELAALEAGSHPDAVSDIWCRSAFKRRLRAFHLRGRRKNTLMSLLYWLSLLGFTLLMAVTRATSPPFTSVPVTFLLMSVFLSLILALLFAGYRAGADLLSSLLPFLGVVFAFLIVRAIPPLLSVVVMLAAGAGAFKALVDRDI